MLLSLMYFFYYFITVNCINKESNPFRALFFKYFIRINQNPYEETVKLQQVEIVPQENTEGTSKFPDNSNTSDSGVHVSYEMLGF